MSSELSFYTRRAMLGLIPSVTVALATGSNRAGLVPPLQRDDREFLVLGIVRPERDALEGTHRLAKSNDAAVGVISGDLHLSRVDDG